MNNKGQVLVLFVIILPIILLLLTFIIDIGLMSIEKRKISNNTYDAVEYYLKENDIEKTKKLLNNNLKDITVDIKTDNENVLISVVKRYKGIFKLNNEINITYKGNINNKRIIKG